MNPQAAFDYETAHPSRRQKASVAKKVSNMATFAAICETASLSLLTCQNEHFYYFTGLKKFWLCPLGSQTLFLWVGGLPIHLCSVLYLGVKFLHCFTLNSQHIICPNCPFYGISYVLCCFSVKPLLLLHLHLLQ